MLKTRLIPILLLKKGRMVKTKQFSSLRDVGDPITSAKIYNYQTVDELVFLDIEKGEHNQQILYDIISKVAEECFMPLTVGGGIRTIQDIRQILSAGADKVSINTAAIENPDFIKEAVNIFGSSTIVISIDVKKEEGSEEYKVYVGNGKMSTSLNPVDLAKRVEKLGVGEILITSIDQEGTMEGYDINLIKSISEAVSIPVIAHGGAGKLDDFRSAIIEGGATAIAAASIFHFTDQSPIKARSYLQYHNINVRKE